MLAIYVIGNVSTEFMHGGVNGFLLKFFLVCSVEWYCYLKVGKMYLVKSLIWALNIQIPDITINLCFYIVENAFLLKIIT